jgi:putative PIN family toxin of toxin-antitoxin system
VRIFLDTNVLVSGLTTRGLCNELLEVIFIEHELLIAEVVLEELRRVLSQKFSVPAPVIKGFEEVLKHQGVIVSPGNSPAGRWVAYLDDPDDVPVLACAIGGKAEAFVTGDQALLSLESVDGMPIVSPRAMWLQLVQKPRPT